MIMRNKVVAKQMFKYYFSINFLSLNMMIFWQFCLMSIQTPLILGLTYDAIGCCERCSLIRWDAVHGEHGRRWMVSTWNM